MLGYSNTPLYGNPIATHPGADVSSVVLNRPEHLITPAIKFTPASADRMQKAAGFHALGMYNACIGRAVGIKGPYRQVDLRLHPVS
jgi:hypothetical protein